MSTEQWDDEKIANTLKSFPKIRDKRTKEEIGKRIRQDRRLYLNHKSKIPRRAWPLLSLAAILALCLVIPLNRTFEKENGQSMIENIQIENEIHNKHDNFQLRKRSVEEERTETFSTFGHSESEETQSLESIGAFSIKNIDCLQSECNTPALAIRFKMGNVDID